MEQQGPELTFLSWSYQSNEQNIKQWFFKAEVQGRGYQIEKRQKLEWFLSQETVSSKAETLGHLTTWKGIIGPIRRENLKVGSPVHCMRKYRKVSGDPNRLYKTE